LPAWWQVRPWVKADTVVAMVAAVTAVAIMVVDMVEATRMVADIMAGLALRRALDTAVRISVRSAMRLFIPRMSATRSICTPVPSATAV
jgi:hypothetical protein